MRPRRLMTWKGRITSCFVAVLRIVSWELGYVDPGLVPGSVRLARGLDLTKHLGVEFDLSGRQAA
jgi:hypothetical protein